MLTPYRRLFTVPHLPAVVIWALLARLHMTCTSISLTFLVADWTGSYARAGLVVAAIIFGWGVGGPVRGRAIDRGNPARQLLVTGLLYTVGIGALALLPASYWPVAPVIAFLTGLTVPAAGQVGRAMYPRLAHGPALHAAYTAEATFQELLFLTGPVAAAGMVALAGPRAALGMVAVLALGGTLGFVVVLRRVGDRALPRPVTEQDHTGRLLAVPGLGLAVLASLLVVAAFSTVDLALVAWARDRGSPALAGVLVAVLATGSLLGGLVSGGLRGTREPRLWLRTLCVALGLGAVAFTLPPFAGLDAPLLVMAVLFLGGLFLAPAAATSNALIGRLAPDHRRAEVFGWAATARTTGAAVAAPVAGVLMDTSGPSLAAVTGCALALLAVLAAAFITVPAPVPAMSPAERVP
ncbi:MAG TPA: MFS transporter [Pseudonocardiaceae bacterium]